MHAFIVLVLNVIHLIIIAVVIWAVMSWLVAFDVINLHNRFASAVYDTLGRIIEPMLRPIRSILPNLGGIDISPVILVLLLMYLYTLLWDNQYILSP